MAGSKANFEGSSATVVTAFGPSIYAFALCLNKWRFVIICGTRDTLDTVLRLTWSAAALARATQRYGLAMEAEAISEARLCLAQSSK
jgi:hypothetical protein